MKTKSFRPPARKTQRRWRIPPALTHGDEVFEGLSVLDDNPGELGIILWQSLRDTTLWATTPPDVRGELFAPGAEANRLSGMLAARVPRDVEEPVGTLARMVGRAGTTREEVVALACRRIAQWADERNLLATALAFTQAAAIVAPGDAGAAHAVGLLARRRAEYGRAETWFRRTIALARQSGDWSSYARAFLGMGNLYVQRGNFPAARRLHIRALKAARRNSLHEIEGMALHDLFGIAVEGGRGREAEELARAAFRAYGYSHPRLPYLAHDVAYFWTLQGYFSRALPVFRSLLPHHTLASELLIVWADIARAAGGAGDTDAFHEAWDEAHALMHAPDVEETAARAVLDLAQGALSIGAWERAIEAARHALEIATRRNEARIRLTAEAVLEAARHHRAAEVQRKVRLEEPEIFEAAESFAVDLVQSLRETAGAV